MQLIELDDAISNTEYLKFRTGTVAAHAVSIREWQDKILEKMSKIDNRIEIS